MASRILLPMCQPAFDTNSNLENGATLTFFDNVTLEEKAVYSDRSLATSLGNVITAASGIFPELWGADGSSYRVEWRNSSGVLRKVFTDISPEGGLITADFISEFLAAETIAEAQAAIGLGLDPLMSSVPMVVHEDSQTHYWSGAAGYFAASDKWISCYSKAYRHSTSVGAPLVLETSYDDGATWQDTQIVYQDDLYTPMGLFGGMVSATRYLCVFIEVDSSGNYGALKCFYKDEYAAAVIVTIATSTNVAFPHGDVIIDDNGKPNIFGIYGNAIIRYVSNDNCATWTRSVVKALPPTGRNIAEPICFKAATGKYIFLVRDDDVAQHNAWAFTTTDFVTTTAWVDSGLALGTNPLAGIVADDGYAHIYAAARRSLPIYDNEDKLLHFRTNALAWYNSGGVIPAADLAAYNITYAGKGSMVGYLTIAKGRNKYLGFMIDGESFTGSDNPQSTRIVRLGGEVVATSALTQRLMPPINLNASFQHWSLGTSFTSITTQAKVCDMWRVSSYSASVDVTRVEVPADIRRVIDGSPRYAMRLVSGSGGSGRTISQRIYSKEAITPYLDAVISANFQGYGTIPGYLRAIARLNFGSGGSSQVETYVDATQLGSTGDMIYVSVALYTPSDVGKTWGTDPYLELQWLSNNTGAVDFNITGIWFDIGGKSIPLGYVDYWQERDKIDRYIEALSFDADALVTMGYAWSTDGNFGRLNYSPKAAKPSVTIKSGFTYADFKQVGFGGSSTGTLSSMSFDEYTQFSCRVIAYRGAGTTTANTTNEIRSQTAGATLIVDSGAW